MNGGFGAILFMFVVGAIVFFVVRHSYLQSIGVDGVYETVARRWKGRSVPGGFLGHPLILFHLGGEPAKVDVYSTGGKHPKLYTQLHLAWPDPQLRCEVYPEHILHGVGKMLGMTDIQIGFPEFDDRYIISGNSDEAIRRLLSPEVQLAIESLRRFLGNNDINVSIRGGRLLIKKRSMIRDQATLDRFIRLGRRLHEAGSLTNTDGIEFVEGEQAVAKLSLDAATCQVCGDDITVDAVFCQSCKTPHHRDCWEYYGSCSTYGCGQPKFLVIRDGAKVRKPATKRGQGLA